MADVAKIGVYQLQNLIRHQTKFLYFDLRSETERADGPHNHPLLVGTQAVEPDQVLAAVQGYGVDGSFPIVLICENGSKSVAVAETLEQNSFINVFVIEGGVKALEGGS